MGTVPAKSRCAGKVTADLRSELEPFQGMEVQATRDLGVIRIDPGPGTLDVVEPFRDR